MLQGKLLQRGWLPARSPSDLTADVLALLLPVTEAAECGPQMLGTASCKASTVWTLPVMTGTLANTLSHNTHIS